MSNIKLISKKGSPLCFPYMKINDSENILVMKTFNKEIKNLVSIEKTPYETELISGVEIPIGCWVERPKTDSELKMIGIDIDGIMCSLTAEDQWGLHSVKSDVLAGASIGYLFENGSVYVLTPDNIVEFERRWKPARAAFFPLPT